ncbi:MAG TPA: phosphate ABC transporter permease subunit PstC [Candidatus Cryptobacteroides excrementigallinarum]|nr:phosphate ABC transporter permease subunit PstC [Candidatus Cryptobacteroides excrementigallinarum]
MKRFLEKAVKWLLTASGFVTSLVILLIIGFLFTEGAGLFREPVIEEGYVLAINKDNPVRELDAAEIKAVFDEDVTNWKELGGQDLAISTFRLEDADEYFTEEQLGPQYENAGALIAGLVASDPGMVAFVPESMIPENSGLNFIEDNSISAGEVFGGTEWFPTATPAPLFGMLPLLLGTLWVSLFAILFALPFGISIAVYMSEVASPRIRNFLKPVIELLNGIPSVVYGFFGLIVIVPMLQRVFGLPVGESGLAGSLVLAIMALPTIVTVAEDAMRNCPRTLREASLALGASKWQTIYKVVIPSSMSGIASGVVLGIGRAVGETMAVLMVTGNAAVMPHSILEPLRTIPATIAAELGEAPAGGAHYQSLFLLGVILFFITFIINMCVEFISARNKAKYN